MFLFVLSGLFIAHVFAQASLSSPPYEVVELILPSDRYHSRPSDAEITHIVLHFNSTIQTNPENPYSPLDNYALRLNRNFSTHYQIQRDGTIVSLVDELEAALHCGEGVLKKQPFHMNNLDDYSIGILLIGISNFTDMYVYMSEEDWNKQVMQNHSDWIGYTEPQYESLKWLVDSLVLKYGIQNDTDHIIGHEEYSMITKVDPGIVFDWTKLGFEERKYGYSQDVVPQPIDLRKDL